jgi:hypothetical protein
MASPPVRAGEWPSATMVRRRSSRSTRPFDPPDSSHEAIRHDRRRTCPDPTKCSRRSWSRRAATAHCRRRPTGTRPGPPILADLASGPLRGRRWPSFNTVRRHFGSFNRAILEAGLRPRQPGQRGGRPSRPPARSAFARDVPTRIRIEPVRAARGRDENRGRDEAIRRHVNQRRALVEPGCVVLAWATDIQMSRPVESAPLCSGRRFTPFFDR